MRLSTRLTIAMVALVLVTATAIGLLTYRNVVAIALPRGLDRIDTHAHIVATVLEALFAVLERTRLVSARLAP